MVTGRELKEFMRDSCQSDSTFTIMSSSRSLGMQYFSSSVSNRSSSGTLVM